MNSPAKRSFLTTRGFTLMEILMCIIIMGILAGLLYPSFKGVMTASKDTVAITKCESLNSAAFTYGKRVPGASTTWNAASNSGRYDLLYAAGYLPNCPSALSSFTPSGYTITLPTTITGRCTLSGPSGSITY